MKQPHWACITVSTFTYNWQTKCTNTARGPTIWTRFKEW